MKKKYLLSLLSVFVFGLLDAETSLYRAIINNDPSNSITLGWNQKYFFTLHNVPITYGPGAVVHYDTTDYGQDVEKYRYYKSTDRRVWANSMLNSFATLRGLQSDTKYYFVIEDADGVSERFWFKTLPIDNRKLFFIAGGDTRSNQDVRRKGNKLVSKLKPDAVLFGGDMTFYDDIIGKILPFDDYLSLPYSVILDIIIKNPITDFFLKLVVDEELPDYFHEWKVWFEDWQLTTTDDGRLIPIVPTRGNHELANESISDLFNTNEDVYYASTFGGNLVRIYTLNSESPILGDQKNWLEKDLEEHKNKVVWKFAQYHTTILPHSSTKEEYPELMEFANIFTKYGMDLAIECDTHVVKTTYPISVSDDPFSEKGFLEDQDNGTIYVGEGTWGAPLRENDNNKRWTKHSGSFNQFNIIFVDDQKLEIKKLDFDKNNPDILNIPDNNDKFSEILKQAIFWNPDNDGTIIKENKLKPIVKFVSPMERNYSPLDVKNNPLVFRVEAEAFVNPNHYSKYNKIKKVDFFVNNQYHSTDDYPPYEITFDEKQEGVYNIKAVATDESLYNKEDYGVRGEATKTITIGDFSKEIRVMLSAPEDDAVEFYNGKIDLRSSVLPFYKKNTISRIGTKFRSVEIPKNAYINEAYVVFKAKNNQEGSNSFKINVENTGNSKAYFPSKNNISNRQILDGLDVNWDLETNDKEVRTPNLSCLVSSLVRSDNWQDNGDINFIFQEILENGNTNPREFFSYNSSSTERPYLVIKYTIKTDWEKEIAPKVSFRTEKYNHSFMPENYSSTNPLVLTVNAYANRSRIFNPDNVITKVDFYVNNQLYSSDRYWPYTIKLKESKAGLYVIDAVATDLYGLTSKSTRLLSFGDFVNEIVVPMYKSDNLSFENNVGTTHLGIYDNSLLLGNDFNLIGLRFQEINVPSYAKIENAYIKFSDGNNQINNSLSIVSSISIENNAHSNSFVENCSDISSRSLFSNAIVWENNNSSLETPNLANLVTEIIKKPDWEDNDGMNFVLNTQIPGAFSSLFLTNSLDKDILPKLVVKYSVKTEDIVLEKNQKVLIYPTLLSESNSRLNIIPNNEVNYMKILIYNMSSVLVYNKELKTNQKQSLDLSNLPSGIYFMQATGQNGEVYQNTKILK